MCHPSPASGPPAPSRVSSTEPVKMAEKKKGLNGKNQVQYGQRCLFLQLPLPYQTLPIFLDPAPVSFTKPCRARSAHGDLSFSIYSNLLILWMKKLRPKEIVSPLKLPQVPYLVGGLNCFVCISFPPSPDPQSLNCTLWRLSQVFLFSYLSFAFLLQCLCVTLDLR